MNRFRGHKQARVVTASRPENGSCFPAQLSIGHVRAVVKKNAYEFSTPIPYNPYARNGVVHMATTAGDCSAGAENSENAGPSSGTAKPA